MEETLKSPSFDHLGEFNGQMPLIHDLRQNCFCCQETDIPEQPRTLQRNFFEVTFFYRHSCSFQRIYRVFARAFLSQCWSSDTSKIGALTSPWIHSERVRLDYSVLLLIQSCRFHKLALQRSLHLETSHHRKYKFHAHWKAVKLLLS